MKKVEITLYSIDELDTAAKEHALDEYNSRDDSHHWGREVEDTLEAFEREFGVRVPDWRYSPDGYDFTCDVSRLDGRVLELCGNRARSWFWNNHGRVLLHPRTHYWFRDKAGKWIRGLTCDGKNLKRASKCLFDRVYDGTCPFTGVCFDCDVLDPVAYFAFGVRWDDKSNSRVPLRVTKEQDDENTVESVLRACVDSLLSAAQKDWEYQRSMEAFEERCECNGWTFTKEGRMYNV